MNKEESKNQSIGGLMQSLSEHIQTEIFRHLKYALGDVHLHSCGEVRHLEEAVARHFDLPRGLGVCNTTFAFLTVYRAMGFMNCDVHCSPYASPEAVAPLLLLGNRIKFMDVDPVSLCADPASAFERIGKHRRGEAILISDTFGFPADTKRLRQVAKHYALWLIADCTQSLGAMRDGQHAGSWAHAAVCSVGFPGVSSAVEGGVIVTADEDLFQRMVQQTQPIERQRRDCPSRMCNEFIMNMTMNPSSAVIAYFAFEEAKRQIKYRQEQATALLQALISDGLCVTPLPAGGIEPSYHTVTFEPAQGVTIPDLRDWLIRHGLYFEPSRPTVDKLLYQLRNYQLMAHRKGWPPAEACPVAERQNRVRICLAESAGNGKLRHNSGP